MRKILIGMTIFLGVLSACAPKAQPTAQFIPNGVGGAAPTQTPVDPHAAQQAASAALAQELKIPVSQIKVISTQAVTWPDGCLGVAHVGVLCTQATVAGFQIVLEANGKQYEYHTNQNGSSVMQAILSSVSSDVEQRSQNQLAMSLGIDPNSITLDSDSAVEFPDSCMGVAIQDVACSQVSTPGRIIVLEANGIQYEYHANQDGSVIQPATLAFIWRRSGGLAGLCDSLTVFRSGEVYANQCKGETQLKTGSISTLLSVQEEKQFSTWMNTLEQTNLDASDAQGVSDRMTRTLTLFTEGTQTVTDADKEALFQMAQKMFTDLSKP